MTTSTLTTLVSLILALSVASERLVEIVKGWWPWLNKVKTEEDSEGRRKSVLQLLAVLAGVVTAYLARDYIPSNVFGSQKPSACALLGLGLLASGGSGLWNSVLTYMVGLKDVKKVEVEEKTMDKKMKTMELEIKSEELKTMRSAQAKI